MIIRGLSLFFRRWYYSTSFRFLFPELPPAVFENRHLPLSSASARGVAGAYAPGIAGALLLSVLLLPLTLPLTAPGWQAPPPCPRSPGLWAWPLWPGEGGGEGTRVRGVFSASRVVGTAGAAVTAGDSGVSGTTVAGRTRVIGPAATAAGFLAAMGATVARRPQSRAPASLLLLAPWGCGSASMAGGQRHRHCLLAPPVLPLLCAPIPQPHMYRRVDLSGILGCWNTLAEESLLSYGCSTSWRLNRKDKERVSCAYIHHVLTTSLT